MDGPEWMSSASCEREAAARAHVDADDRMLLQRAGDDATTIDAICSETQKLVESNAAVTRLTDTSNDISSCHGSAIFEPTSSQPSAFSSTPIPAAYHSQSDTDCSTVDYEHQKDQDLSDNSDDPPQTAGTGTIIELPINQNDDYKEGIPSSCKSGFDDISGIDPSETEMLGNVNKQGNELSEHLNEFTSHYVKNELLVTPPLGMISQRSDEVERQLGQVNNDTVKIGEVLNCNSDFPCVAGVHAKKPICSDYVMAINSEDENISSGSVSNISAGEISRRNSEQLNANYRPSSVNGAALEGNLRQTVKEQSQTLLQSRNSDVSKANLPKAVSNQPGGQVQHDQHDQWCVPCLTNTGVCEDGHLSCEVSLPYKLGQACRFKIITWLC